MKQNIEYIYCVLDYIKDAFTDILNNYDYSSQMIITITHTHTQKK